MTKAASGRAIDQGIADENKVKTLHVFIYDTDAPNTPTVAEFTVDDNSLAPKSPGSSTWVTNRAIKTKKADKYIFAAVNLNADMVNYITTMASGHSAITSLLKKSHNWQTRQTALSCSTQVIRKALRPQTYMKMKALP